jgi:hypothetical protein
VAIHEKIRAIHANMAAQKVLVAVTYSKPGIQPPIYLAGTFSHPPWQPQEMQHTINEQGEYAFTKEVEVEEGKEYQYKFRVGEGDWWLLNEDAPSGTYSLVWRAPSKEFLSKP